MEEDMVSWLRKEEERLRKKTEALLWKIGFVISRPQGFAGQRSGYEVMVHTLVVFISYQTSSQDTPERKRQIQREMLIRCREALIQSGIQADLYEGEEPYLCPHLPDAF